MDPQANPFSALSFIVAPAVLTNASSILTLSTSNRLARAVDRAREITAAMEDATAISAAECQFRLRELAAAQQRMLMLIRALRAFYLALGCFATAALVSLIGAVLTAGLPSFLTLGLEMIAAGVGIVAVGALVRGALLLVRETRIAVTILGERAARVEAEFTARLAQLPDAPRPKQVDHARN